MSLRNVHLVWINACVASLLLAGCVFAQTSGGQADAKKKAAPTTQDEPSPAAPQLNSAQTSHAPPAEIEVPAQDPVDDLKLIPDAERHTEKDLADIAPPDTSATGAAGNDAISADAAARITALEQRLLQLEKALAEQTTLLQGIRDDVAEVRKTTSKQVVGRADPGADASTPAQPVVNVGKLMVENRTPSGYTMAINGAVFFVPPGHRGEVRVPVGAVVTELLGREAPKTWKETDWKKVGDDFQLAIQIQ